MKSRQKIKALKIYRVYDRRGKKYNDKPLMYFFSDWRNQSLRHITSQWYSSKRLAKKVRSGHRLKIKFIQQINNYEGR